MGIGSVLLTLLVTLLVFGILIFIHELGHYLVARKFGVGITEFSIGMGPALKTWHGKYNDFSIRALPIGGFVNMVGEYDDEIPPEFARKTPLNTKPVWQRMLIVLAGPFMNLLLAFILMAVIVIASGTMGTTVVAQFKDDSVSDSCGLSVGDEIIEINGKTIHCYTEMAYKIVSDGVEPMQITVLRDGNEIVLNDVTFGTELEDGKINIGVQDFLVYAKDYTFGNVIYESFWQAASTVYMTVDSLVDTLRGRYGIDAVGGPIAVGGQVGEMIEQSADFGEGVSGLGQNHERGVIAGAVSGDPDFVFEGCACGSRNALAIFDGVAGSFEEAQRSLLGGGVLCFVIVAVEKLVVAVATRC